MVKRFDIHVYGAVQGVLFRYAAKRLAEGLGLAGFAQNESDGSLTLAVEGEEAALRKFIEWCREGPPSAEVEKIEAKEEPLERCAGFEILR